MPVLAFRGATSLIITDNELLIKGFMEASREMGREDRLHLNCNDCGAVRRVFGGKEVQLYGTAFRGCFAAICYLFSWLSRHDQISVLCREEVSEILDLIPCQASATRQRSISFQLYTSILSSTSRLIHWAFNMTQSAHSKTLITRADCLVLTQTFHFIRARKSLGRSLY